MNWSDIVEGAFLIGCMVACMHMWYMQGKLDGVRECRRILEECGKSGAPNRKED